MAALRPGFLSLFFLLSAFSLLAQEVPVRGLYVNTSMPHVLFNRVEVVAGGEAPFEISKAFKTRHEAINSIFTVEFAGGISQESADSWAETLSHFEGILWAEAIPVYQSFYTPNDLGPTQYNCSITQAELGWDISNGDPNIKVAVVDDAFRMDHEDLQGTWATNAGEIAGNGIDDDGNGYIDDVTGWDAADQDNDPNPPTFSSANWTHGTHVAGIVGAETDNGIGIASVGFNVSMVPVKCTNASPAVTHGYEGVDYAISSGAHVINMSWGGAGFSATGEALMQAAHDNGIVCVAAAGNDNTSAPMYPASLTHVISVGATDNGDVRAWFSNYGATIDVMAPGVDILSCLAGATNDYGDMSGTSMAAPFTAGLCGLMLSQNPFLTPDEIEECLEATCDNIDAVNPGFTTDIGAGRVNVFQALQCVSAVYGAFEASPAIVCPGEDVTFTDLSMNGPDTWSWSFPGGVPATSSLQNPVVNYPTAGVYDVTLTVSNVDGTHTITYDDYISVATPTATLSGSTIITDAMDTWLIVEMTGAAPWTFVIDDGSGTTTYPGINDSPFQFQVEPDVTTTYTIDAFESASCTGNISGSATVTVIPAPEPVNCFFTNVFGDSGSNTGQSTAVNPVDYSIYIGGSHEGQGSITHFDTDGTLLWSKSYPGFQAFTRGLVRAPNGDLVAVAGSSASDGYYLIRVSATGDVIWSKKISWGYDRYPQMTRTLGDTYLVAGWSNFGGVSDNVAVIMVDTNGDLMWEAFYDEVDDQFSGISPTSDGGCIVSGGLHIVGGNLNYFVARLDSDGNTVIKKELDSSPTRDDNPQAIELSGGGYATVGQSLAADGNLHVFMSRLDDDMNTLWSQRFGSGNGNDYAYSVVEDSQGNLIGAYRMIANDGDFEMLYVKFDDAGNLIWAKQHPGIRTSTLTAVSPASLVIAANADELNEYGSYDGLIIHEDEDLSSCIFEEVAIDLTSITWSTENWPSSEYPAAGSITDHPTAEVDLDYNVLELCPVDCPDDCAATADFTLSETMLCEPGEISATNLSIGSEYIWALDGVEIATSTDATITIDTEGVHIVTLIASDGDCFDLMNMEVELSILELQTSGGGLICVGDSIAIEAIGDLDNNFSWSPNGSLGNPTSPETNASPSSTTTYIATLTDANGCMVSDEVEVEVDGSCCVTWLDIEYDGMLCIGEQLVFNNQTNTTGTVTWSWSWPSGLTPPLTEGSSPNGAIAVEPGVWNIIVTLNDGCGTYSEALEVIIFENPLAIAGPDTLLCDPGGVQIGGSPVTYHSYSWTGNGVISDPSVANPIVAPVENSWYYLEVTNINTGCSATDSVKVWIDEPLDLGGDYVGCFGDTLRLAPGLAPGGWQWSNGSTADYVDLWEPGTYWLIYENACGIKEDNITIYLEDCTCPAYVPNAFTPDNDDINERFRPVIPCSLSEYTFEVWDRWGEVIFKSNNPEDGWNGSVMNGEYYAPDGMYIWRLEYRGLLDPAETATQLTGHVSIVR